MSITAVCVLFFHSISRFSSLDWQPGLHLGPSLHSKRQRREKTTEQMSTSTYHYIYSSPRRKDRKNDIGLDIYSATILGKERA